MVIIFALGVWAAILSGCSGSSDNKDSVSSEALSAQAQAAPMAGAAPREGEALQDTTSVRFSESKSSSTSYSSDRDSQAAAPAEAAALSQAASSSSQGTDLSSGASIGAIVDANAGYNRKMIYSANIVLKAESFPKAEEAVTNVLFQSGGYIVQFSDTKSEHEIGSTYVIKIPSSGLSRFIDRLAEIPNDGFERKLQGNDVSEEYVDLQARLEAKQAVETRLLAFMDKATKSDDLLKFSNELGSVQEEIERIKGRMRYIDQNVTFSTVNLRLYQTIAEDAVVPGEKEKKGLGDKLSDAMRASTNALGDIGEGLLTFLAAILPILLALLVIGGPIWWGVHRSRAGRQERAEARRKLLNEPNADSKADMQSPEAAPQMDSPDSDS